MLPPACPRVPVFRERIPGARRSPALLCARLASLCVAVPLSPPLPSQALLLRLEGSAPARRRVDPPVTSQSQSAAVLPPRRACSRSGCSALLPSRHS